MSEGTPPRSQGPLDYGTRCVYSLRGAMTPRSRSLGGFRSKLGSTRPQTLLLPRPCRHDTPPSSVPDPWNTDVGPGPKVSPNTGPVDFPSLLYPLPYLRSSPRAPLSECRPTLSTGLPDTS